MRAFTTFAALSAFAGALATPHARRDHSGLAKRVNGSLERRDEFNNGRMTWYGLDTGADACTGKNHKATDYVVALNQPLCGGDGNGHCGKKVQINYQGKSAVATVVDCCASCPETNQLDLTQGLFSHFTDIDQGVFYADWSFVGDDAGNDDGDDDQKTTKKTTTTHKPTTTHKATPTPTTHKTTPKPTPTTTQKPKPTTSSSKSSSTVKPSSSSVISSYVVPSSSLVVIPSSSAVSVPDVVSTPAVVDTPAPVNTPAPVDTPAPVNAGADPSASSAADSGSVGDIQGAVGSNGPLSGSGSRLSFNSAAFGLTALLILVQAL